MSLESFIRAMPKVELNVQLEAALQRETLMIFADDNNIIATMKPRQWTEITGYIAKPDLTKVDEITRALAGWIKYPEDLTRAVYDLGLALHRQHVRYAEVSVSPAIYTDAGMTFEEFLEAINDGRDRVERAWKVRMNWVLTIPRDRPRKGDDIARWVTSATARKGNVVGIGIDGREDSQPVGQFAKAFATVEKKGLGRAAHAHTFSHTESVSDVITALNPTRISDTWGLLDDPAALTLLAERDIPLIITPTREVRLGRINTIAAYPLVPLMDQVRVIIASGMPEMYKTTLNDEFVALAKQHELGVDEVTGLALNAVLYSFLPDEQKQALYAEFTAAFDQLRAEHLAGA